MGWLIGLVVEFLEIACSQWMNGRWFKVDLVRLTLAAETRNLLYPLPWSMPSSVLLKRSM
jgi:hypothetical protein